MRKHYFLLLPVLITCFSMQVSAQVNLQQGLVAYYPFNGNANDVSGNGNHGVVYGATLTEDRFGNGSSAYYFDGNDYINISDNNSLRTGLISLSAWILPEHSSHSMKIIGKSVYTNANNEQYALSIEKIGNQLFPLFALKRLSSCIPGYGWQKLFGEEVVTNNAWSIITTTWDEFTMKIYFNGILVGVKDNAISGEIDNCIGGDIRIGLWWMNDPKFFKGYIDDIRIYNRALNEQEIYALYTEGQPPQANTISNIFINQRNDGSGMVDVYFNLYGTGSQYNINLDASFDGGNTYTAIPTTFLSGDVSNISPGTNKHIMWNGLGSHPNTYSIATKLKIIAN